MRALRQFPPHNVDERSATKYMYLWIRYALYEEFVDQDVKEIRNVYKTIKELAASLPVDSVKFYLFHARFEIRKGNLEAAQKIADDVIDGIPSEQLVEKMKEIKASLETFEGFCKLFHSIM
ncbi:hypothetical protein ILUMI_17182 [Ignelater luminosus]|uniref:Suppressor of forked domain-containing protein n=1 Tax=Ignelater luminosus TaxID=2038154 RepID=A0A8K0G7T0_IGNLU|nr:hypothetical protein ILUMI_17182 [Ignelater luminosus]